MILLLSGFLYAHAIPSQVQLPTYQNIGVERSPVNSADDITNVVINATKVWYTSFFIFAVIFILIAAFKYMTAQGDAEGVKTAHKMLVWSAVALAVALISVGAVFIVRSFLGGNGGGGSAPQPSYGTPPSGVDYTTQNY